MEIFMTINNTTGYMEMIFDNEPDAQSWIETQTAKTGDTYSIESEEACQIFAPRNFGRVVHQNVGGGLYNGSIKKGKTMKTICVFCMGVWSSEAIACLICHEYKGIMPLNKETLTYLGEDLDEWEQEYNLD